MKLNLIAFAFIGLFLISLASAGSLGQPIKQGETFDLVQTCSDCTFVELTSITYPNGTQLEMGINMTKSGEDYKYSFGNTTQLGTYKYNTCGDLLSAVTNTRLITCETISFEVTPNGLIMTGWSISLQIFVSVSTLILFILFLYLSGKGLNSGMAKMENGASRFFFMGLSLVFLIAHILITNVIVHDTFGSLSNMAKAYTSVMYIFFTIIILIFLYTLIKVLIWEVDIFLKSKGKR